MPGLNSNNIQLEEIKFIYKAWGSHLRANTWLRARSKSSPFPELAAEDFEGSILKLVVQALICSTALSAEE